ncbi:hypothetical protein NIES2100_79630 (plasmid) [Calothrix sp. NIES-2100]|nr:hypothetical protein NIES2100_79630 [Calothrix sp. NIES-2100]
MVIVASDRPSGKHREVLQGIAKSQQTFDDRGLMNISHWRRAPGNSRQNGYAVRS